MKIDLTKRELGCVGHPLIRLNRVLKKIPDNETVEIFFRPSEIPEDAILILLRKRKLRLIKKDIKNNICVITCIKE